VADEVLADVLTAAFRPYVLARLDRDVDGLDEAISAGEVWLMAELGSLLALPYAQQSRGPLEVFQEAIRFPTHAMQAAGIEPVVRDEVAMNALPGDIYDLAPASSRDLGEQVWEAHLRWGAAKAEALRRG
jgi:hypothetical protein